MIGSTVVPACDSGRVEKKEPASPSPETVFRCLRLAYPGRLVILAAALAWSPLAHSLPIDWIAASDDWFDPANWSPAQVPTAADDVSIDNGGTAEATAAMDLFAASLSVGVDGGDGTLIVDPRVSPRAYSSTVPCWLA